MPRQRGGVDWWTLRLHTERECCRVPEVTCGSKGSQGAHSSTGAAAFCINAVKATPGVQAKQIPARHPACLRSVSFHPCLSWQRNMWYLANVHLLQELGHLVVHSVYRCLHQHLPQRTSGQPATSPGAQGSTPSSRARCASSLEQGLWNPHLCTHLFLQPCCRAIRSAPSAGAYL